MSRANDVKKSDFVAVTSALTTDFMDLVRSGQNFKISIANLTSIFGASGPLETLGEVTGTPVLVVSGDVNYIRNLIAGDGIRFDISPQSAIEINHAFDVDKTGEPIIQDELSSTPDVVSLVAGAGITVTTVNQTIEIEATGSGATKLVNVFDIDDFPTPSLGIITLADDTEYLVHNDISTTNRFIFGNNTVLSGLDSVIVTLTYTDTATMFTATDKNIKIRDIFLSATSGTMFSITDTGTDNIFRLFNCGLACNHVGTISGGAITYLFNCNLYAIAGTGFVFAGSHQILLMDTVGLTKASGAQDVIDFGTATFDSITLTKLLFNNNGTGFCIDGAAASANINSGGIGTITNLLQLGSATILNNITPFDNLWEMQLNSQIYNSYDEVLVTKATSTIAIATAATPVVVDATGSAWVTHEAHRFTTVVGGRWTYVGKGSHVSMIASISASIATGTDDVTYYWYKNGVQIADSAVNREFTAGDVGNVSMIWSEELENGDYLELWVQNDDTNVDIEITKITVRINS